MMFCGVVLMEVRDGCLFDFSMRNGGIDLLMEGFCCLGEVLICMEEI
jgi:hypothetical protein